MTSHVTRTPPLSPDTADRARCAAASLAGSLTQPAGPLVMPSSGRIALLPRSQMGCRCGRGRCR